VTLLRDTIDKAATQIKRCDYTPARSVLLQALATTADLNDMILCEKEPVAWLHEKRPDADVITDAVKNVWNGVVVGKDSAYSIPLYSPKGIK